MFRLTLVGVDSAARLAQRLTAAAVTVAIGTERAQIAVAHGAEGIITPLVRDEAPVKTGALQAGLRAQVVHEGAELVVSVHSDQDYARHVLEGTGVFHQPDPHSAWDVEGLQVFTAASGETVFTYHTHHEGSRPNDFVGRAEERAAAPLASLLYLAGEQVAVAFRSAFTGPL
jgi:hypothetical protein